MCRPLYIFLVLQILLVSRFLISCEHIKIGGLFDQETDDALLAFQYAVDAVNAPKADTPHLEAISMRVPFDNEFLTSKKLCKMLKMGVAGIFGPTSPTSAAHIQSICDEKELPLMQSIWDFERKLPIVNLYPSASVMEKLIIELIKKFEWKSFTILYETGQWISRVAEVLEMYDPKGYTITVSQLSLSTSNIYRQKLRRVKDSEDKKIIIDCSIESLPEILKQAQQVGLMSDQHQFIITNLDLHTIDLEPYQYSGTNITGFRMIDPQDPVVIQVTNHWNSDHINKSIETPHGLTAEGLKVDTALIYDSVLLFSDAIEQLQGVDQLQSEPLLCEDTETFNHGYSLINYMRTSVVRGLTKFIKFDNEGNRNHFDLELVELASAGIRKIGTWSENHKLEIDRGLVKSVSRADVESMKNVSLKVITAITPPYGMLKKLSETMTGNDRYEGFGIELIEKLSEMLGFNYTFGIMQNYGNYNNDTGAWDGMMKEIMDGRYDLAITDFTITAMRESAVDFTNPFMNLGISILFRKPSPQPPSLFSFMSPFSNEVWMYLGAAYLGVSMCLFILGRISPNEWDNPYPCIQEPDELENQFSVSNSLWFTIGALLQQGTELAPKTPSTRTIASIWWFFTLIMVSSYTANLAAFLTVEQNFSPINSAEDLANANGKIPYGAKEGGSTLGFFLGAGPDTPIFQKMGKYMSENPQYLTQSNDEGLTRVENENYAYIMESTSIEYITERHCEVRQLGGLLDNKNYGIAMKKGFIYRNALSEAVLRLQEQGKLTEMKNKWWKEKHGGGACSSSSSSDSTKELGIPNVLGIFVVLIVGSSIASVFGFSEWIYLIIKASRTYKVPFKEEFISELKFVAKCGGNTRTIRQRKDSSSSRQSAISGRSNHSMNSLTPGNDRKPESCGFKRNLRRKDDLNTP